ncbi:hypothetical protein MMC34_002453 [Xylographa carneopallida]|nr:hypothetical protein [Xylographa carneopallida]
MSKVKGIGGLVVVTVLGVLNGVYIFGPALKDQELQKLEQSSRTNEATQVVDQQIFLAVPVTSSSDVAGPATSRLDSTKAEKSSIWPIPKLRDWKTFWKEGDRASMEKNGNSIVSSSIAPSDNIKRTVKDAVEASNTANP